MSKSLQYSRKVGKWANFVISLKMDESLGECWPIPALESLSADSCDKLEVSMGNLSLCDAQDGKC